MALIRFEAFSEALNKAFSAQVVLPETNRGPFPVLWLLHGAGDNETGWLRIPPSSGRLPAATWRWSPPPPA